VRKHLLRKALTERVLREGSSKEAKAWDALVVAESNSYGLSIIEHLIGEGYANLYRRTSSTRWPSGGRRSWVRHFVATRPVILAACTRPSPKGSLSQRRPDEG
jgi:hypothetical protein